MNSPGTLRPSPTRVGWPLVSTVGVFSLLAAWFWPYTMDDAFISFRYAKHIGDGIGPVWNLFDRTLPVEGFTAFLQVWLLGLIRLAFGANVELVGKSLGVVSTLVLAVCVASYAKRSGFSTAASLVALSFLWVPAVAMNSVSGMETSIFLLTNWLCVISCVELLERPSAGRAWKFVLFGLAGTLTRPESAAPFLLMTALVWWRQRPIRPVLVKVFVLGYVLPGLAVTGWRLSFYGDFLPHPFYAKQATRINWWGTRYVLRFLAFCAMPYLLLLAAGWRLVKTANRNILLVTGLNLGFVCLYFTTVVPTMGWWFRFLIPQIPVLAFCAAVVVHERVHTRLRRGWLAVSALLFAALCTAQLPLAARLVWGNSGNEFRYREVGKRLRPLAAPDRWLTFHDVGSLVYESEWNTIDLVGLNTHRSLLRHPCQMKTDLYLTVIHDTDSPDPCPDAYDRLVDLPFRSAEGLPVRTMRIYARRELPYATQVRERLLEKWPEPFRRPYTWFMRYTEKFSFLVGG